MTPPDYLRMVMSLIASLNGIDPKLIRPETRLVEDLNIDREAAQNLLRHFTARFNVDMSAFRYGRHFRDVTFFQGIKSRLEVGFPIFSRVPLTVGELATAARSGRWNYNEGSIFSAK